MSEVQGHADIQLVVRSETIERIDPNANTDNVLLFHDLMLDRYTFNSAKFERSCAIVQVYSM